jgi:hypothetical protein
VNWPPPGADPPEPNGVGEVIWLQPYPDILLEGLADATPGPEARYEATEAISLAFITALQALPPRQRAALILHDVLGFPTSQVAGILDGTEDSAASALKRARATMRHRFPPVTTRQPPPRPGSPGERDLVDRFTRAYQDGDVAAVVALLTEDISLTMPPLPLEYHGRDLVARFLATTGLRPAAGPASYRPGPTGSPRSASTSRTSEPGSSTRPGCSSSPSLAVRSAP